MIFNLVITSRPVQTPHVRLMLAGLPNVGKSSLINAMRRTFCGKGVRDDIIAGVTVAGKAARTGALPGVTRAVLTDIRINDEPPVYVMDTPGANNTQSNHQQPHSAVDSRSRAFSTGIMLPNIRDPDVAMKLALIGVAAHCATSRHTGSHAEGRPGGRGAHCRLSAVHAQPARQHHVSP